MKAIEKTKTFDIDVCLEQAAYPWTRRIVIGVLGALARFFYPLRMEGREKLPAEGPYFICGNHLSFFDILLVHPVLPIYPHWLAKIELFRTPIVREVVRRLGAIPVDRGKGAVNSIKNVFSALKQKRIVGVFPQGTRVPEDALEGTLPKKGMLSLLVRGGHPIYPFCIVSPYRLFRTIRIVFGDPFCLNIPPGKRLDDESAYIFSKELMNRIYEAGVAPKLTITDRERLAALRAIQASGRRS